jgi:serine/threonine protein kinase
MRCSYCAFEGTFPDGRCPRCGAYQKQHNQLTPSTTPPPLSHPLSGPAGTSYALMRGDSLAKGRYRILSPVALPETQRKQGHAWLAIDSELARRQVFIRELLIPPEQARGTSINQIVNAVIQRMQLLGQHQGFPQLLDCFNERGTYFLVFLHPEGETLGSLLRRQGGALPEALVVHYGYQLCGLLAVLADQQPPIIHGSINPETIVINEAQQSAWLLHVPPFAPAPPQEKGEKPASGYYAPEQVRGELDPSADLYSLAATLHHAVTGYDPNARLVFFHPPARRLNPAVSPQMEMILVRQLSLSRAQRYSHPLEMQKDLGGLLESYLERQESDWPANPPSPLRLPPEQFREQARSNMLLNAGVFAAIGVLLILGVLLVLLRP